VTTAGGDTVLESAGATDAGTVRSNNEDHLLLQPQQRLWIVADGMGGHRGGEVASQIACETLAHNYGPPTIDGLVQAINAANTAVYETGRGDPELSGMGTTVVTLAVIEGDQAAGPATVEQVDPTEPNGGEILAIANVGDSRAYRFTGGQLQQLTRDHSLVADMVREGSLSPEEAESHPRKNIVTRALGMGDEVPVDVFTMVPRAGDRYLLCTDGLSDELPLDHIAAILSHVEDTNEAVHELIRQAVHGGARDNVTVVLVDVVDSHGNPGNPGASARELVDSSELRPITGHAYAEPEQTARYRIRRGDRSYDDAFDEPDDDDESTSARRRARRQRRFTWRVGAFLLLVIAVVAGAIGTIQWYGRSTYYVGFDGDDVAIYHGRPGGVLWIEPTLVETSELQRDEVPADAVVRLDAGLEHSSLGEAQAFVERLEERVEEIQDASS
jgi:PPM family protein phosphatase